MNNQANLTKMESPPGGITGSAESSSFHSSYLSLPSRWWALA